MNTLNLIKQIWRSRRIIFFQPLIPHIVVLSMSGTKTVEETHGEFRYHGRTYVK